MIKLIFILIIANHVLFQKNIIYKDFKFCSKGEFIFIQRVNVEERVDECTTDVLVSFELNSFRKFAFLTKNGTLKEKSRKIDCSDDIVIFTNFDLYTIARKGNLI